MAGRWLLQPLSILSSCLLTTTLAEDLTDDPCHKVVPYSRTWMYRSCVCQASYDYQLRTSGFFGSNETCQEFALSHSVVIDELVGSGCKCPQKLAKRSERAFSRLMDSLAATNDVVLQEPCLCKSVKCHVIHGRYQITSLELFACTGREAASRQQCLETGPFAMDFDWHGFKELRQIFVSGWQIVGDIDFIQNLRHLTSIQLINVGMTGNLRTLRPLWNLENLVLQNVALEGTWYNLDDLDSLLHLTLLGTRIQGEVMYIHGVLDQVRTLSLNGNSITASLQYLMGKLVSVREITLSDMQNITGDVSLIYLLPALLYRLDLRNSNIGGELLPGVRWETLDFLDVRGTNITGYGLLRQGLINKNPTVLELHRDFRCYGLDHAGFWVDPETFAPRVLCECITGFSGIGADCHVCPAGKYSHKIGLTSCVDCESGKYQERKGTTSCNECAIGKSSAEGSDTCGQDTLSLIILIVFFFVLTSTCLFVYVILRGIVISDVARESEEGKAIIRAYGHHFMLSWRKHARRVYFKGTGHPQLDTSRYCVQPIDSSHLLLLDVGDGLDASLGLVQQPVLSCLCSSGYYIPSGLMVPLVLAVFVPILLHLDVKSSLIAVDVLASFLCVPTFGPVVNFWRERHPVTRLITKFKKKLPLKPRACMRGPDRAISIGQALSFHKHFQPFIREDRNMYYVCTNIIKPMTKQKRLSYAEMAGPRRSRWFVSHYWGTPFGHFMHGVVKHAQTMQSDSLMRNSCSPSRPDWRSETYWICSLSNNQWKIDEELGGDWEQSSFYLALQCESTQGTVMILDDHVMPLTRSWCIFELLQTFLLEERKSDFHGLFLVTHEGVIGSGQASIRVALNMAELVADFDLRTAKATNPADKLMIDSLVESYDGGFATMNKFIRDRMQTALKHAKMNCDEFGEKYDELMVSLSSPRKKSMTAPELLAMAEKFSKAASRAWYDPSLERSPGPRMSGLSDGSVPSFFPRRQHRSTNSAMQSRRSWQPSLMEEEDSLQLPQLPNSEGSIKKKSFVARKHTTDAAIQLIPLGDSKTIWH